MLELGPLAFANPWILVGLAALPAIWLLIRAIPPSPQRTRFPAIRLLYELAKSDPPSAATPWWLLLLRMLIAALIILSLASPLLNPRQALEGAGPVLIVVENGWTSAEGWSERQEAIQQLIREIGRAERSVILVPTAAPSGGWREGDEAQRLSPLSARDAQDQLRALAPRPWSANRGQIATWLNSLNPSTEMPIFYVNDGLGGDGLDALIRAMKALGPVTLMGEDVNTTMAFQGVSFAGLDFDIIVTRANTSRVQSVDVEALAGDGTLLARTALAFNSGEQRTKGRLIISPDVRTDVAKLAISGSRNAGAVYLLDDSAARPYVGIIETEGTEERQPLRSARFYINRALQPFAQVSEGDVETLLSNKVSILILSDSARLSAQDEAAIDKWIEDGGLFIRFAGPKLAAEDVRARNPDPLLPVALRLGERAVGGALSWSEPQKLGPFPENGPFAGLIPSSEVVITRQVLAQPALDLAEKTWARLEDETPLVTSERRGLGRIVLFHTTAAPTWSNLALSGTFVDMLQRLLPLAKPTGEVKGGASGPLAPIRHLDGFGVLIAPFNDIQPIPARGQTGIGAKTPPGLYGSGAFTKALNLSSLSGPIAPHFRFTPLSGEAENLARRSITDGGERHLMTPLLVIAALLAFIDAFISLALRGHLKWPVSAAVLFLAFHLPPPSANAQDSKIAKGAGTIQLGCVMSGSPRIDQRCLDGLDILSLELRRRTSVWPDEPVLVRPEDTALGLYPLLYWPVVPGAQPLSDEGVRNISAYMRQSGLIIFDTGISADDNALPIDSNDIRSALQHIVGRLNLPPLEPLSAEHVLSHSFYILDRYPGRLIGRTTWVEQGTNGEDGRVSPIIIGGSDWMGAWADGGGGNPRQQLSLSGNRQQELSIRFGINAVMYALTGTYKSDQVHLPALIERLGN